MNANELRIGNAIWDDTRNKIKWVNHRVINDLASHSPLPYSPILLTPEILGKFGWAWNEDTNSFENHDVRMHLQFRDINSSYTMFNYVLKAMIAERIWHLHQLQNIYFALTGSELEYNP